MNRNSEVISISKKSTLTDLEEKIMKMKKDLGNIVDEKLKKKIEEIEAKLKETKTENSNGEKNYSSVLLEGTNIDNSKKDYTELKTIFDSKKSELEDVCKNYIRAKLCENLFPIGTSFSESLKDIYLIVIQYILIRLTLICMMDKNGNLPDKVMTMKIFETINKCFYAKRNSDLMEMTIKYIKSDDIKTMMSLLSDI
jgi:hypothetical protein